MSVANNLIAVHDQIKAMAKGAARDPASVNLVAVSKRQEDARIEAALKAGHRLFGENRVQEAQDHWAHRRADYPDLKLHLIGPLQSNKAADAVALFDVIETVDREKIARALSKEMQKQSRKLPCFIQVNTGEEDQKSGVAARELPEFLAFCREECGLDIEGLMCIPPLDEPAALHFGLLKTLADHHNLLQLSMGMSGDFEKAIPLGATYIRLGTAIFGDRD